MPTANTVPGAMSSAAAAVTGAGGKTRQVARNQQLGQDEFLKLLTTQLKSQDPMKPVEDTQFIAQMAQFSSLNQMQTLNKNFEAFNKNVSDNSALQTMAQASSLIGQVVSAGPSLARRAMGTVQQVRLVDGQVHLVLRGVDYLGNTFVDKVVPLGQVIQVGMTPEEIQAFQQETEANMLAGAQAAPQPRLPDGFTQLAELFGIK